MKRLGVIWLEGNTGERVLVERVEKVDTYVHCGGGLWWMYRDHTN